MIVFLSFTLVTGLKLTQHNIICVPYTFRAELINTFLAKCLPLSDKQKQQQQHKHWLNNNEWNV